jgi:hypothetical protein
MVSDDSKVPVNRDIFDVQSGKISVSDPTVKMSVMSFEDPDNSEQVEGQPGFVDPTRSLQDSTDASLEKFLSRPVLVNRYSLQVGQNVGYFFDPWSLFLQNSRVANRITNFNLLRCDLKVKVVINGNPFAYGRIMVSYNPLWYWDYMSHTNFTDRETMLVQQSQRPKLFIDPCTSTGGTMTLPFFHYKNYISIPSGDFDQLGEICVMSTTPLKNVNGGTDTIDMSIFAWAENVSLSVPTHENMPALQPQSGKEVDEANEKGTISGPATTVANMARSAAAIPTISPFAMATSKVAEGIASTAKLFGMSRPPMTAEPTHVRPIAAGSLALTNTPARVEKLSVDEKQELTIDPRISGLPDPSDQMSILSIAQKETYITQFTWPITGQYDDLLFNMRVTPMLSVEGPTVGTALSSVIPAITAAAMPFSYWTGCIKYRFQIVCSAFHRGRLRIVYDPNFLDSSPEDNVNYCEVIDLSAKNDFSIVIHNSQKIPILPTDSENLADSPGDNFGTTRFLSLDPSTNGVLGVYVQNALSVPGSLVGNDVQINVFASAGDDFEVFAPNNAVRNFVFYPQSGVEPGAIQQSGSDAEPNKSEQNDVTDLGICNTINPELNMVYFGESIKSFRSLLKRYNFHELLHYSVGDGTALVRSFSGTRNLYPYYRGAYADAPDTATVPAGPYALCNTTLFHWVVMGFQGYRGGMRYKIVGTGSADAMDIAASRSPSGEYSNFDANMSSGVTLDAARNTYSEYQGAWNGWVPNMVDGGAWTSCSVNPILDIEIPYYSQWRFVGGKNANLVGPEGVWSEGWRFSIISQRNSNNAAFAPCFVATADDFQCYWWTGMPVVYLNSPTEV